LKKILDEMKTNFQKLGGQRLVEDGANLWKIK